MKHSVILKHQLPGAQMPPDIRISHIARSQDEEAKRKNNDKQTPGLKQFSHG